MKLSTCINNDITPLSVKDRAGVARDKFKNHTCSHLPVVEKQVLLGTISECDAQSFEPNVLLENYSYALVRFFVKQQTHWLDVLEVFAQNEANVLPVLGDNDEYLGYYDLVDIMKLFNNTPFLNAMGDVIVIEKGIKDYSFSEIAQIVESNSTRLMGIFVSEERENQIQITLKVAGTGLNAVMQTFRRYGYTVISGNEDDTFFQDLKDRSNYLNKYLNM